MSKKTQKLAKLFSDIREHKESQKRFIIKHKTMINKFEKITKKWTKELEKDNNLC